MSLLSAIKSRFFAPELIRVAKKGDASGIAECLTRSSIIVVAADLGDSAPVQPDEKSAVAILHAAAEKKSFDGEVHKYEIDGETFLPLFTDTLSAESFCGAYCDLLGRLYAFRLFRTPGSYVQNWIDEHDTIVMNPQNESEIELDREQSAAVCESLPRISKFDKAEFISLALPVAGVSRTLEFRPKG